MIGNPQREAGWWTRYWSAPGGRIAAAAVRIALAISVLVVLDSIRAATPVQHPEQLAASLYRPVGILLVFRSPPPAIVIELALALAVAGAVAMLLGLFTRVATAVTALTLAIITAQAMSFQPSWSHDLNVVVLAVISFLGARGGDALALDVVIRRWRGSPPVDASYQWSLRLAQLAVGLMFLSACVLKLRSGGVHWALSDNLRHQLLARYDLIGEGRPALVDWLLASSWRYQGAAALNLISQAMPLFAIVFPNRPLVRGLAGLLFVTEVAGLYVVMQLGNPSWFPLAAVFVDWDRLWARLARRPVVVAATPVRVPRAARVFVAVFVVLDLVISLTPGVDQRLRSYPFSRFPMFAVIRAKPPYAEHQSYEMIGGRIELVAERPIERWMQAEIDRDYVYRTLHRETDRERLRARAIVLVEDLQRRFPAVGIHGARIYVTMYQAPAYPATARLEAHDLGILGELVDGTWTSHWLPVSAAGRVMLAADPALAGVALAIYREGLPAPELAPVAGADGAFQFAPGRVAYHLVARFPGPDGVVRPYLIARRVRAYW